MQDHWHPIHQILAVADLCPVDKKEMKRAAIKILGAV
jgi:hypothetical protein